MVRTIIIIVLVVAGGLAFAFLSAPDNDALDTSGGLSVTPPMDETVEEDTHGDAMDDEAMIEDEKDSPQEPAPEVGINKGDLAADFTLQSFDGASVTLSSFRGQPVLIDFWAGWCPFCINELPELEAAHQKYSDDGFVVLGIHRTRTESVSTGAEFAKDRGVTYALLQDSDDSVYRFYSGGQNFMPVAYFIDASGVIQDRVLGPKSAQKIESSVQNLLAQ